MIENDSYYFYSLKDEMIEISKVHKTLWEYASGKNTVENIIEKVYQTVHDEVLFEVFNFYRMLEYNFALIFRKY